MSIPVFDILPCTKEDYDEIDAMFTKIQNLHYDAMPDHFQMGEHYMDEEYFKDTVDSEDAIIIKAVKRETKEIIGAAMALYYLNEDPAFIEKSGLILEDMYVSDEYRHQGIAQAMLKYLENIARSEELDEMCLTVWSFNKNAKNFYSRYGFVTRSETMAIQL